jgi:hypothetical protein
MDRKRRDFISVLLGASAHKEERWQWLEWSSQPGNKTPQEETPSQKEREDVASAALGREGTLIHR